jgi:WD40 repeat protein
MVSSILGMVIINDLDGKCKKYIKAHEGPINCFERMNSTSLGTYITGGDDGLIKLWESTLEKHQVIDFHQYQSSLSRELKASITSVHWQDFKFTIGTRSGEIYYGSIETKKSQNQEEVVDLEDGKLRIRLQVIVNGHSDSQITGVAVSYVAPEIFTIGTNNILMKWDYNTKKCLMIKKLDFPAKLLELSVNNNFLAVGCFNGTVLIVNPVTLDQIHCHNSEKKEITALTFSQSNENLGIGYVNGVLNILSSPMKFKMSMEVRNTNMNPIVSLDFSEDNCYLKGTFSDLETILYDVTKRVIMKESRKLAEERWSQWTSLVGWEVQGIWSEYESPLEVCGACRNEEKDILVVWDKFGGVKCFKYPCLNYQAPFVRISMSGMKICTARFSNDNKKLFLLGSNDSAIVQYSVKYDSLENQQKIIKAQEKQGIVIPERKEEASLEKFQVQKPRIYLSDLPALWPKPFDKKFMSRHFNCINMEVRSGTGINKIDFRNPVIRANADTLIYFCGTSFVQHILNKDKKVEVRTFSHFHTKRVTAMDIGRLLNFVATGEAVDHPSQQAMIVVHDLEKLEVISRIYLCKGESCRFLRFSPGRDILVCISEFQGCYKLMLIDWVNALMLQSLLIGNNKVNDIDFKSDDEFATVGDNHIVFWKIKGNLLEPFQGNYGANEVIEFTACAFAFEKKLLFTGTSGGYIGVWGNDNILGRAFQAHQGEVLIMKKHKNDTLFTAGSEGVVYRWGFSDSLTKQAEVYDLKDLYQVPTKYFSINPALSDIIVISELGEAVRTGTKDKSEIVFQEITSDITTVYLLENEGKLIVTTADSRILWMNLYTCRIEKENKSLVKQAIYICGMVGLAHDHKFILGDSKGVLHLLNANFDFEEKRRPTALTTFNQAFNRINLMKMSENEKYLAVTSTLAANKIEIYEIFKDALVRKSFIATNCFGVVNAFDWDMKSQYILINTDKSEMALLDVINAQKHVSFTNAKGLEWYTMTTMFNFFSSGLNGGADGSTDITAVCTKKELTFLVAGTKDGSVSLTHKDFCREKPMSHEQQEKGGKVHTYKTC